MKHSISTLFVVVLLSMTGLKASAHDIAVPNSDGVTIYYNYSGTQNLIVTFRGSSYDEYANEYAGSVVIPSSVMYYGKTYQVTTIGERAFCQCKQVTSVTIPNTITSIGSLAFGYSGITSMTIPNSVKTLGTRVFEECESITSMDIPSTITNFTNDGYGLFCACTSLVSVTLPNTLTEIGSMMFQGCI